MSDRMKFLFVGIFVLVALVAVAWLFLFLKPSFGDGGKLLRVRFSNIEKITLGTPVTFSGRTVGEVIEINEIYDARDQPGDSSGNPYFYELVLRVDSKVNVYNYDEIVFSSSGLLGEKVIAILPKQPPSGGSPPHEITSDTLYARSTDTLSETLQVIRQVACKFETALGKVTNMLDENREAFNQALISFTATSDEFRDLVCRANETDIVGKISDAAVDLRTAASKFDTVLEQVILTDLVPRMTNTFDCVCHTFQDIQTVARQISNGEGTLGRLIQSDCLYWQLSKTLGRADRTLNDINRYGLLFQYDKKWQREQALRQYRLCHLTTPCDFYALFDEEMQGISYSLDRVSDAIGAFECSEMSLEDPCFAEQFDMLQEKVKTFQENLNCYQQRLLQSRG